MGESQTDSTDVLLTQVFKVPHALSWALWSIWLTLLKEANFYSLKYMNKQCAEYEEEGFMNKFFYNYYFTVVGLDERG